MGLIDDYLESVKIAYSKPAGNNWPARGKQLMSSYIRLAAMKQFSLIESARKEFSKERVAQLFWSTTQIRYVITGEFVVGLKLCERDLKSPQLGQIIDTTEYLLSLLQEKTVEDSFCLKGKNNCLNKSEVDQILSSGLLEEKNNKSSKILSAALASFSWAFGFDTHFPNFMDIQGPYSVGDSMQLFIRDFNFENLGLIWEKNPNIPARIRIYLLYKNSDISLDWELHTESASEFDLAKSAAVIISGGKEKVISEKDSFELIQIVSDATMKQVEYVNSLPVVEKIKKGALLSFLQVKGIADALGVDWRPDKNVEEVILSKGEDYWFGRVIPNKKSVKSSGDDWLSTFDPRIPKE